MPEVLGRIRAILMGIRDTLAHEGCSAPTLAWLRLGLVTVIPLVVAGLLLSWVQGRVPLGDGFTLRLAGEEKGQVEKVYDVLEHREYRLAYGVPPTLQISIQPTSTVRVTSEGQNKPYTGEGQFTLSLSDLMMGTNPVTDIHHIWADGPWGSRRHLWLIYRPESPYLDYSSPLTRTLSANLFPGYAELNYRLTQPAADDVGLHPAVADLMQGEIGVPVFLKWTYYPELDEDGFTGKEFDALDNPAYYRTDDELTIEISALVRDQDYTDKLNRLLRVSQVPHAPRFVSIEIQTEGIEIAGVYPPPDEVAGSHWVWRQAPVKEMNLRLSDSWPPTEALGNLGLAIAREKLDQFGAIVTKILFLFLPMVLFIWWGVLARRRVTVGAHGWTIWLGALLWLAPLVLYVVHGSFSDGIDMGLLAMTSALLALGFLALGFPAGRSAGWRRRLLWIGAATLAVPLVALGAQFGLRYSWAVAGAASLVLLGVMRLTVRSFWPDRPIPLRAWVLIWVATTPLIYPVPIPAFGFTEGIGWPPLLLPSFHLILAFYVLPYVVLAMTLGLLRDRERELSAEPPRLVALSKLLFVYYLVGGTRGLTPDTAPGSGSLLPSVYPLAFVLALLLVHRWLMPDGQSRLRDLARFRGETVERRAELIQAALDIERARRALNQLLQGEDSDLGTYEARRKTLEKYLAERQMVAGLDQPVRPEKAVFAYGPYAKAWDNGLLGGRRALFIGAWLLMIYLPSVGQQAGRLNNPFLFFIALVAYLLPLLARWVLLGFFLGYFFPHIRGGNGWQKGLCLALAVAACTVPHDLLNGGGLTRLPAIGLDVVQNALLLTLLGLWAFDYETLRQHGHGWRRLLIVHNLTFLTGYGTSLVAALGSTIAGLLTGRLEPVLRGLLELLVPVGQPPV